MLKLATKFAPRPTAFENAHHAGFGYVELWLDAEVLAGWETVVAQARAWPLGYALHFPNRLDSGREPLPALEQTVSLYRALASSCLVIHQPMFDRHAAELLRHGPELRLAIENHKLTPEAFLAWAENSPGLTLDVEHLWKFTLKDAPLERVLRELRLFLTRFADKLRHVHMPGYLPGQAEHRPMYCSRDLVFGAWSLFQEFRFEGLIVSEINPEFQAPPELRMDVLLFESWRAHASG